MDSAEKMDEWQTTSRPCKYCRAVGHVVYRVRECGDGAYDDTEYHCSNCEASWWFDGADA